MSWPPAILRHEEQAEELRDERVIGNGPTHDSQGNELIRPERQLTPAEESKLYRKVSFPLETLSRIQHT